MKTRHILIYQRFRFAVPTAVSHMDSAFSAFYRRKRAQGGPQFAQVATAHKLARTVYFLLKYHVQYIALGTQAYEQKQREPELAAMRKKAAKLGVTLVIPESATAA